MGCTRGAGQLTAPTMNEMMMVAWLSRKLSMTKSMPFSSIAIGSVPSSSSSSAAGDGDRERDGDLLLRRLGEGDGVFDLRAGGLLRGVRRVEVAPITRD